MAITMQTQSIPVSMIVDRNVLPNKVDEFKVYLKGIIAASSQFPGYMGTDVINPEGSHRYIVVFRFSTKAELDAWTTSEERQVWIDKIDKVIEGPSKMLALTGLESWFVLSKSKEFVPPPKHKMAIVTYLGIAPLLTVFNALFGELFSALPLYLLYFATSPFIVILMTYLVMPAMTRLFMHYLFKQP